MDEGVEAKGGSLTGHSPEGPRENRKVLGRAVAAQVLRHEIRRLVMVVQQQDRDRPRRTLGVVAHQPLDGPVTDLGVLALRVVDQFLERPEFRAHRDRGDSRSKCCFFAPAFPPPTWAADLPPSHRAGSGRPAASQAETHRPATAPAARVI